MRSRKITVSTLLIILTLLFSLHLAAQTFAENNRSLEGLAFEINHNDINSDDFSDFAALKNKIGNSRIVMLGEESHGAGHTFLMKGRLIKFLHEEMGFNVLAWESGVAPVAKVDREFSKKNVSAFDAAKRGIFYTWVSSNEVQPLLKYLKGTKDTDNPIINVGMDSQFSGWRCRRDFYLEVTRFLKTEGKSLLSDENQDQMKAFFDVEASDYYQFKEDKEQMKLAIETLKSVLKTTKKNKRLLKKKHGRFEYDYFRFKVKAVLQDINYTLKYFDDEESLLKSSRERDKSMGKNFIHIAEKLYPDEKIIIWAHSGHTFRNANLVSQETGYKPFEPLHEKIMGHVIHEKFGDQIYSIAFTSYEGEVCHNIYSAVYYQEPAIEGSLEWYIYQLGYKYSFVDLKHLPQGHWLLSPDLKTRFITLDFFQAPWAELYDAFIYAEKSFPKSYVGKQ
jgi:erythromycin esterase